MEEVSRLLAAGAPPSAANKHGLTALHMAAMFGRLATANALLQAGACVDARDGSGETPLMAAAAPGHAAVVAALLRAGAAATAIDLGGGTALHALAYGWTRSEDDSYLAAARALLGAGGSGEAANGEGETPVGMAAERGAGRLAALLGTPTV